MNRYRLCNLEWTNHFHNLTIQKRFLSLANKLFKDFGLSLLLTYASLVVYTGYCLYLL